MAQSRGSHTRIVLASLVGAAYSFIIVLPPLPVWLLAVGKLLLSVLLILLAFPKPFFWKHLFLFYLVNFLYAGLLEAALQFFALPGFRYQNGIVYFQLSAMRLCLLTVIAYGILQLFSMILFRTTPIKQRIQLRVEHLSAATTMTALLDTGNLTRDVVSGLPVIVCEKKALAGIFSPEKLELVANLSLEKLEPYEQKQFRLIPMKSISGHSLLAGFQPEQCLLEQNGSWHACDAVIAITNQNLSNGDFHAIIPAKLIN